jgi:hypothetical protein
MSRSLDHILEDALALSLDEQNRLRELLSRQSPAVNNARQAAARRLFGKYAHAPTSSAEFSERKASEIPLEEHPLL